MKRKRPMEQPTFADLEYTHKKHKMRREKFLERLEGLVSWERLEARIEPHYPEAGNGHRLFSRLKHKGKQPRKGHAQTKKTRPRAH